MSREKIFQNYAYTVLTQQGIISRYKDAFLKDLLWYVAYRPHAIIASGNSIKVDLEFNLLTAYQTNKNMALYVSLYK